MEKRYYVQIQHLADKAGYLFRVIEEEWEGRERQSQKKHTEVEIPYAVTVRQGEEITKALQEVIENDQEQIGDEANRLPKARGTHRRVGGPSSIGG